MNVYGYEVGRAVKKRKDLEVARKIILSVGFIGVCVIFCAIVAGGIALADFDFSFFADCKNVPGGDRCRIIPM